MDRFYPLPKNSRIQVMPFDNFFKLQKNKIKEEFVGIGNIFRELKRNSLENRKIL